MEFTLVFLGLSIFINAILTFILVYRRKRRKMSREAEELLSDILRGGSLVHIQRIAPENVFLKIPR